MKTIQMNPGIPVYRSNSAFWRGEKPIKWRRTWGTLNPVTKVKQSKLLYKRDKRVSAE